MLIKILIIEDEVLISDYTKELLEEEGFDNIKQAFTEEEASFLIKDYNPDIVLMDINLGGINSGIKLAENIKNDTKVIFVTGQYDYDLMSKALNTQPESYLTKPIKKHDLIAAINLVISKQNNNIIKIKNGYEELIIPHHKIKYLKADGNYLDFILVDKKYTVRNSITNIFNQLSANNSFLRLHRSYVVNSSFITKKTTKSVFLDELEIPIGRYYSKNL